VIKSGVLAAALIFISQLSFAASACVNDSLSRYIALGTTGCAIGTTTLFDFAALTGITGATIVAPANIALSPFGTSDSPGLTTTVAVSATAGTLLEGIFTYRISGTAFGRSFLTLAGSSETGDGAVTGVKDFCAGGVFGPNGVSGCTGTPGILLTLDGVQNADSASFGPSRSLSVTDDFTIDGGTAGSASAGTLTNRFGTVPEPGTILLTFLGFGLTAGARRKFIARRCS